MTERLEIRIKKETKEIIKYAANLIGLSLTDFVINASYSNALKLIEDNKNIKKYLKGKR